MYYFTLLSRVFSTLPLLVNNLCILLLKYSFIATFFFFFRFCDEGTCTDKANILYAWARNAPPTRLPKGISKASWIVSY